MPALTPSETVLLAADRLVPPPSFTSGSYVMPVGGAKVAEGPLVEAVLTAALLALERDGRVTLARVPKSEMLGLRTTQTVHVARVPGATPPEAGTLEAGLFAATAEAPAEASAVVSRWFGDEQRDPTGETLARVLARLVERGAVTRTETRTKKLFWTSTNVQFALPDATRAALDDVSDVQALLADSRADLLETLRSELREGLVACTAYGDPSYGD